MPLGVSILMMMIPRKTSFAIAFFVVVLLLRHVAVVGTAEAAGSHYYSRPTAARFLETMALFPAEAAAASLVEVSCSPWIWDP